MPDIFGRMPDDYALVQDLRAANSWDAYQAERAAWFPGVEQRTHNFDALGQLSERATEDQQSVGFLTSNLLAIQTMVDEIMYTAYRLPEFVHINTSIPEGASSYGIRVQDRVGQAQRISGPGYEAPSATVSQALVQHPIHWYGIDAEWSTDELRGAMFAGIPLDTESVDAATMGAMETMEAVGLTGGEYAERGLLNLPVTGTDSVVRNVQMSGMTFAELESPAIRDLINGELSAVIEGSRETLGGILNMGMTVYLPGPQYDLLTTKYIGDNAERTLMRSIIEDNPWTHFTGGQPLMIKRVLELAGLGTNAAGVITSPVTDRMVVGLKHSRVAEIGVSISPRVLEVMNKGRVVCAQIEAKFSPLFVKRPNTLRYVDLI